MEQRLEITGLDQEQLSGVLRRAHEIDFQENSVAAPPGDLEAFLKAAEEVGISREATLKALREQLGQPLEGLSAGDRVFAKSADGAFYAAAVESVDGHGARVRFVSGSEYSMPVTDLRGFTILPGQKLQVNWPSWGWWTVEVETYDPKTETLTASDGWSTKSFKLDKVRLGPEKKVGRRRIGALIARVALISASIGAVIGGLVARFLF